MFPSILNEKKMEDFLEEKGLDRTLSAATEIRPLSMRTKDISQSAHNTGGDMWYKDCSESMLQKASTCLVKTPGAVDNNGGERVYHSGQSAMDLKREMQELLSEEEEERYARRDKTDRLGTSSSQADFDFSPSGAEFLSSFGKLRRQRDFLSPVSKNKKASTPQPQTQEFSESRRSAFAGSSAVTAASVRSNLTTTSVDAQGKMQTHRQPVDLEKLLYEGKVVPSSQSLAPLRQARRGSLADLMGPTLQAQTSATTNPLLSATSSGSSSVVYRRIVPEFNADALEAYTKTLAVKRPTGFMPFDHEALEAKIEAEKQKYRAEESVAAKKKAAKEQRAREEAQRREEEIAKRAEKEKMAMEEHRTKRQSTVSFIDAEALGESNVFASPPSSPPGSSGQFESLTLTSERDETVSLTGSESTWASPLRRKESSYELPCGKSMDADDFMWDFQIKKLREEMYMESRTFAERRASSVVGLRRAKEDPESPQFEENSGDFSTSRRFSVSGSMGSIRQRKGELTKLKQQLNDLESVHDKLLEKKRSAKKVTITSPEEKDNDAEKGENSFTLFNVKPIGRRGKQVALQTQRWGVWKNVSLHCDKITMESETNMPFQDLHLYQMFCANRNMIICIRPISTSVPDLYAGTALVTDKKYLDEEGMPKMLTEMSVGDIKRITSYECRIKGKSINVSLKSSPYPPIDGLIPFNPSLGKAYLEAQRREREIEDMLLNAQANVLTVALLRKLKMQKAQAGSLTQAFVRDITDSLARSDQRCGQLLQRYHQELILTVDKASVSRKYFDELNESQFLSTTEAKWRGFTVYYTQLSNGTVLRNQFDAPVFHIKKNGNFYLFNEFTKDIHLHPTDLHVDREGKTFLPVEVVTHRTFVISKTTNRIEEDPEPYLIGPDFDGLAYCNQVDVEVELSEYVRWADEMANPMLTATMGLVNSFDVEHVKEMRELTEWKQNHGYEAGNTVKSQPLVRGAYPVILPWGVKVIHDFQEIAGLYRNAWKNGYPLTLNPNWKIQLDHKLLPRPYGEDLFLPIIDDCGKNDLMSKLDAGNYEFTIDDLAAAFFPMEQRVEHQRLEKQQKHHLKLAKGVGGAVSPYNDLFQEYCEHRDKKRMAGLFYDVRRWQLMPPLWRRVKGLVPESKMLGSAGGKTSELLLSGMGTFAVEEEYEREDDDDESQETNVLLEYQDEGNFKTMDGGDAYFDPTFEQVRKKKVRKFLCEFERGAEMFDELHPKNLFLAILKDFLHPESSATTEPAPVTPGSQSLTMSTSDGSLGTGYVR